VVKLFEKSDAPHALRKAAIQTIGQLCKRVNVADHASRIVHPLARVLDTGSYEIRLAAIETLCALVFQLGADYAIFIPMINKVFARNKIQHPNYEMLVSRLLKGESLPQELGKDDRDGKDDATPVESSLAKKLPVNQQHLKKAWEASQRSTRDDWTEWIRRLSVELLKESPSHALRACAALASSYVPLSRELFNAGFVSCWTELYDQYQEELVRALEQALTSPNIPPETLQVLLNLAEFMEHDDKALPIDIRTLGAYATKCHAFAKALHYKEAEFHQEPSTDTIEALISINNLLQQPDAANGILTYAQEKHGLELKESWYEKLDRWEEALQAYDRRQLENPGSFEATTGRMRCLHALGEWDHLADLSQEKWVHATSEQRRVIAPLAAAAAWGLGQWESMDNYVAVMKPDSPDRAFFKALLHLHRNQFNEATSHINRTRDLLDTELSALVSESYNRAYITVVRIQMMAELEEIIQYKQYSNQPERQLAIRNTWVKRLKGCQRNVDVWDRMLKLRALVLSQKDDLDMWIKLANLCRKSNRPGLSEKTLAQLVTIEDATGLSQPHPKVTYAQLKHSWAMQTRTESRQATLDSLRDFTLRLSNNLGLNPDEPVFVDSAHVSGDFADYIHLLARCYLKQGEWQKELQEEWSQETIPDILHSYLLATRYDKDWYKAWHAWALANFDVITYSEKVTNDVISPQMISTHIVPSVQGFFRSILLSKDNSLQDTLRLLTLWFNFGQQQDVSVAISEGFSTVTIDTWLQVIPQLIARIHAQNPNVRRLIHQLLMELGKEHPQSLIYSLMTASKSQSSARKKAALGIMDKMRLHYPVLVDQALMVSQELIRVAILWHEMWHEGLEEASRLFFGDHKIQEMFATLDPLHQMLERGPETMREVSFNQQHGADLQQAQEWCNRYKQTQDMNNLNQAWELYYQVFRKIAKSLPSMNSLELQYVSPKLLNAKDLELAVPGTRNDMPIVYIKEFASTVTVINSKQRPRKITMMGSDGRNYTFLLKGHEDIRQDERVMQLFGLVNTLLGNDSETYKRRLKITRYSVIPLSPNSGLAGWVQDTDTLHTLIRDYRETRKILLNIEHRLMLQMAPDYDNLTLMQKVEVFQYALDNTTGQDLYRVLWLKSRNSESWLERRTNYTRSLATMSMVGYILGLGDRHPSNLMLDQHSGKIVHIDFGDCFEVAMHREKFPEKIPFRLTRMLVHAMEVSGIEGNFRTTCQNVMRVLRENKESVMAVLEAFVYDPLINWKLLANPSPNKAIDGVRNSTKQEAVDDDFRKPRKPIRSEVDMDDVTNNQPEVVNARALAIVNRVSNKLTGRDFKTTQTLDVSTQVQKLIEQAMSLENLCQCYIGWCSFW